MKKGLLIFGIILVFGGFLSLFGIETDSDVGTGLFGLITGFVCIYISVKMKNKVKKENKTNLEYYDFETGYGFNNITTVYEINKLPESFVVLDLETTGLDPLSDRICEIGILVIENGMVVKEYNTLINPEVLIPEVATNINGITNQMVKDEPKIHEIIDDVFQLINNKIIVGYNVMFDIKFIGAALYREKLSVENINTIDVLSMVRKSLRGKKLINKKLQTVKEYFGIQYGAHRAIEDCKTTFEVMKRCLEIDRIDKQEIQNKQKEFINALNNDEEFFIKNVKSIFAEYGEEVNLNILSDKTINFTIRNMQIGRVKLRGRKMKIQTITKDDVDWIEIGSLEEALIQLPKWERYYKNNLRHY